MGIKLNTLALLLAFGAGTAAADDQLSSQQNASTTHNNGSNDSLNESYGNALTAVSNFFDMNIPGAVSYGLKAYGQYRNSNQMDDLRDKNNRLANSMASMASSSVTGGADSSAFGVSRMGTIVPGSAPGQTYASPYARLDPSFLHQGETGAIAAKLEKMSGMNRDKMLALMADVHARSLSPTDPGFIPWAMKTYKEVTAKMPDEEFRGKLESLGGYLETAVNSGFAKATLGKFIAMDTKGGKDAKSMVAEEKTAGPAPASVATATPAPAATSAASDPSFQPVTGVRPEDASGMSESQRFSNRGVVAKLDDSKVGMDHLTTAVPVDGYLGDMIRAGSAESAQPSLFQMVSNKLKEMSARQHLGLRSVAQGSAL